MANNVKFKKDAEAIIKSAEQAMQPMLYSVYDYNSGFFLSSEQKKLLNKILFAMFLVDRKFFVEDEYYAYEDTALHIGKGQTISQPSTVARMLVLAVIGESDDILEVGSGSGWNACLLAFLTYPGNITSIERISALTKKAEKNVLLFKNFLKQKNPGEYRKFSKINLKTGNIFENPEDKKYDKIIITAGIVDRESEAKVQETAQKLLNDDGLLICPYTSGPLLIYKKQKNKIIKNLTKEAYVFVPLLSGTEK